LKEDPEQYRLYDLLIYLSLLFFISLCYPWAKPLI
jgi:hypothetical protein